MLSVKIIVVTSLKVTRSDLHECIQTCKLFECIPTCNFCVLNININYPLSLAHQILECLRTLLGRFKIRHLLNLSLLLSTNRCTCLITLPSEPMASLFSRPTPGGSETKNRCANDSISLSRISRRNRLYYI